MIDARTRFWPEDPRSRPLALELVDEPDLSALERGSRS
jgi:hypothetical protein